MQLKIVVDLANYLDQTLNFRIDYETGTAQNDLTLPAFAVNNGIKVRDLAVLDSDGQPVNFTVLSMKAIGLKI